MMGTEFQWKGHNILIQSRPSLRYLWLATETVVKVDGREIGCSGGFGLTERIVGNFSNNQHLSELVFETKTDLITLVSIPYKLQINRRIVSQGRLRIDNWLLFFVPVVMLISILMYVILR